MVAVQGLTATVADLTSWVSTLEQQRVAVPAPDYDLVPVPALALPPPLPVDEAMEAAVVDEAVVASPEPQALGAPAGPPQPPRSCPRPSPMPPAAPQPSGAILQELVERVAALTQQFVDLTLRVGSLQLQLNPPPLPEHHPHIHAR